MNKYAVFVALALCVCARADAASPSPYTGQQSRDIKALSAEDVDAYLAGKGMGLAKVAELNGYPGPSHVLELAAELRLTPGQRQRTEALFASMRNRAIDSGRELVAAERDLDRLFASKEITPASLAAAVERIGVLHAKVRATHLDAHLSQMNILSPSQVARYRELRGYAAEKDPAAHGTHRH